MPGDEYKTIWVGKSNETEKSWGRELAVGALGTIQSKILYIRSGESTAFKYYTTKDEVLFIRAGEVLVEYDSEKWHYQSPTDRILKKQVLIAGEVLYIQSQCPYKITAIKDSEIFEIGGRQSGDAVKIEET